MKMGEEGAGGNQPAAAPEVWAYAEKRERGASEVWPVKLIEATAKPEDDFGQIVEASLSGAEVNVEVLASAVAFNCLKRVPGEPPTLDPRGGALLQEALAMAFTSSKINVDDLTRDLREALGKIEPNAVGFERLADHLRGARVAAEYIKTPLPPGTFRYASLDLDVYHATDYVEVKFSENGQPEAMRLVQVKAGMQTAAAEAASIHAKHGRFVDGSPEALRRLAEVTALEEALLEEREVPFQETAGSLFSVVDALDANVGATLPPEAVKRVAPLVRAMAHWPGAVEELGDLFGIGKPTAQALLDWAQRHRMRWLSAARLVAAVHPNVVFANLKPMPISSAVVSAEWLGGRPQSLRVVSEKPLNLGHARAKDALAAA